jgi:NitT/TauT family transport system substrate-binding protein
MNKKGRRRRVVSLLASVTLISALAAACSSSSGPSSGSGSLQSVTARMDWLPSTEQAPFYLALARGYYKDAGMNVTLLNGGPGVVQGVASGKEPFGYSDVSQLAEVNQTSNNLEDVCTLMQVDPTAVVSLKSDPITKPTGLYGKKVGYEVGGESDPHQAFFGGAHLDASKIQLVGLNFSDFYSALVSGKVQADLFWWFADAPIVNAQKPVAPPLLFADYGANILSESIIVKKSFAQHDPKLVRAFVQATVRGIKAMIADPVAAVQAIKQYQPTFDTNTAVTQVKELVQFLHTPNTAGKPYCWTSPADVQHTQTVLQKYTGLPKSVDLQSMITNKFVG